MSYAADTGVGARPLPRPSNASPANEPAPTPALAGAEAAERAAVEELLNRVGGVVSRAAAEMGLSREAFYRRMERLGIAMERRVR